MNEALRKNVCALNLKDPRSGYDASVNLETMEHICWGVVRAMKFTDRDGRVLTSWDCLNEETVSYKNERLHFDNLSCYLYWKQYSCQLKCEFTDPAALQEGDSWEDALLRGTADGVIIPECRIKKTDDITIFSVNWQSRLPLQYY